MRQSFFWQKPSTPLKVESDLNLPPPGVQEYYAIIELPIVKGNKEEIAKRFSDNFFQLLAIKATGLLARTLPRMPFTNSADKVKEMLIPKNQQWAIVLIQMDNPKPEKDPHCPDFFYLPLQTAITPAMIKKVYLQFEKELVPVANPIFTNNTTVLAGGKKDNGTYTRNCK